MRRAATHIITAAAICLTACGTADTEEHNQSNEMGQAVVGESHQSECLGSPDSTDSSACAAMDATLQDFSCDTGWGYKWDGRACVYLGGACDCVGSDCYGLYETQQACEEATHDCMRWQSAVVVTVEGSQIEITDNAAVFNCCLESWMEVTLNGSNIAVVEIEDPDDTNACDCECTYQLSIAISNLAAGSYNVSVYRGGVSPESLLHEESVIVSPAQ